MGASYTLHAYCQIRPDRFEPPQPPRLRVWYGYCAHVSDAGGFGQSGRSCQRTELQEGPRDWKWMRLTCSYSV